MNNIRPYRGMIEDGKWVVGYYSKRRVDVANFYEVVERFEYRHFISYDAQERGEIGGSDRPYWIDEEVNPKTISQAIGRKDIHGKEIFEGDIVKDMFGNMLIVYYDEYVFGYRLKRYINSDVKNGFYYVIRSEETYEIIGNIYDNPELLEASDD